MIDFESLSQLSPLPLIDLSSISRPTDGFSLPLPTTCHSNFKKDDTCRNHYKSLALLSTTNPGTVFQCPYGFSTLPFRTEGNLYGITALIPFPRIGGDRERLMAKRHPDTRIDIRAVKPIVEGLKGITLNLSALEDTTIQRHSMALHEIRKLNAKVKQAAERLCREASPNNPENAREENVMIWKAAELMSNQFEVMELLANQRLTELPIRSVSELYRIFDKCARVYRMANRQHKFVLKAPDDYHPRIYACEKTLPIIPTVLIENANKYSRVGSDIWINFEPLRGICQVTVSSLSNGQDLLSDTIFGRGVRASTDKDGSGNGLFVAQLVAKQHGTLIRVKSTYVSPNTVKHEFIVPFNTI